MVICYGPYDKSQAVNVFGDIKWLRAEIFAIVREAA